ncbi:MAG: 2-isopropylmalate synthase [Planctomycetaceae bacterium]|nr:2-isopropylmalate synthase [Planctomycetaceae bacterium]
MNTPKYTYPKSIDLPDRQWPSRTLSVAPIWCSVDLRDGNQALPNPLNPAQKLEYFKLLTAIGFRHIEVSFPSASKDDFDFTRVLIEQGHLPPDVFMMVLCQCRSHLIERSFESLAGAPRAIMHLYCPCSELHMQQVFGLDHPKTMDMVVKAIAQSRDRAAAMKGSDIRLEFSPEEFTDADFEFVLELCEAVVATWGQASPERPLILNLPATVERRPPNQYADMIELFCRRFSRPQDVQISLHAHNDQGMAVAATELALLAGGQRVEGTLFGHGERTGNVDIVTVANNLFSRGIPTGLDFSKLPEIAQSVHRLTGMEVYYRQPYAGQYVFTAFSGSHQDAIRKGMKKLAEAPAKFGARWKVPYLHVDPVDLGRQYEDLIRINSQSGKGGVVWVLEQEYGLQPPKSMHPQIGAAVQQLSDRAGREVSGAEVYQAFVDEFVNPAGPYELIGYWPRPDENNPTHIHGEVRLRVDGQEKSVVAEGNGPISAFCHAMHELGAEPFAVDDYQEQAVGKGEDARAMAYVPLRFANSEVVFGVGSDTNIDQAAVRAIVAGLNRRAKLDNSEGR